MSHYLTKKEIAGKTAIINKAQEKDSAVLSLTFIKDEHGWYADVPGYTRSQNAMVAGADMMLDCIAGSSTKIAVKFRTLPSHTLTPIAKMCRFQHAHGLGGTYLVKGITKIPFPAWLCDVTHAVIGEHAKTIYLYSIEKS